MGNTKSTAVSYPDGPLEINLSNFKLLRVVGKGSYGKVYSSPLCGSLFISLFPNLPTMSNLPSCCYFYNLRYTPEL